MIFKVGKSEFLKDCLTILYREVPFDCGGWADASKYLPSDYDLVHLKIEGIQKPMAGWSVGKRWEGREVTEDHIVNHWKRNKEC